MAIGLGAKLARLLLLTFNLIFWLSGIGLVGTGIWLLVDSTKAIVFAIVQVEGQLPMIKIGAEFRCFLSCSSWVIAIGCFVILVGFLGCCGAMHENRCMLVTYFAVILVILLAELVGGILVVIYKNDLESKLQENMQRNLRGNYGVGGPVNQAVTDGFDYAQYTFACCGVAGPIDYNTSVWIAEKGAALKYQVPISCCIAKGVSYRDIKPENKEACESPDVDIWKGDRNEKGCYEEVKRVITSANGILIGVGVGIAVLELLGMLFAICLCRNIDYDI
ncbi:hypothetical protein BV898_10713 [Hypsibius exemplaris]|uniref:Tetraspanin n=1 Tax=Hypsibius exemplaris TaxID=2072580 RepID=A0A1W0WIN7_HYPEX|nr:hypothetical protein BV898_10713 [Hypsibius exemplaris]